jgi:polysaccharide biosynthesis/export protein
MFRIRLTFIFLAGMLMLNSCRTQKDLTYLADMKNDSLEKGLPGESPDYILKPNDNLYVNVQSMNEDVNKLFNVGSSMQGGAYQVYGEPSGQYVYGNLIDKAGTITLPVLGKIEVAGMTQTEAQAKVQLKANEYLKEATVKLKLLNFRTTILGEVKAPGVYYNYNNELTVLEAVSKAGGFTDHAKLNNVLVMRNTNAGTKSYRLDLTSGRVLANPVYYLQPNDVVYAGPAKVKALELNSPTISLIISTLSFLLIILKL